MLEVQVRITCVGWRCRRDKGAHSIFEGYLPMTCLGSDNIVSLKVVSPKGWAEREDFYNADPTFLCPLCLAGESA